MQVRVHLCFENRDAAELAELGGVGLIVKCTGDQDIEVGVACFAGGSDQIGTGDGTELRADEDACPFFGAVIVTAFDIAALGTNKVAGSAADGRKDDLVFLMGLLDAGGFEIVDNHLDKIGFVLGPHGGRRLPIYKITIFVHG